MKPDFKELGKVVKQVKAQDSAAFSKLYELTYQRLYLLAFSILKNEEDAKDAVQESYIKIYTNIHTLQDDILFLAWANKIVYYICIRMNSKNMPNPVENEVLQSIPDDNSERDPVNVTLKYEKQKALADLIDKLSPELRTTLFFKYYEDLKIHQIAKIMDCPSGTVKSRLNTAKKQLKAAISKGPQSGLLLGVFPIIPFRQAFTYSAAHSGMAPSEAYEALVQSLSLSGLGAAAGFRPQLPLASAHNPAALFMGGTAAGSIVAVTVGTVILSAPVVNSISVVNPPAHYTREDVAVTAEITSPMHMLSRVYVKDTSGRQIPVTVSEDGKTDFTIGQNGEYTVYAVSKGGQTATAQINIDCIDKTSPVIRSYENKDTEIVLVANDDLSGIDYDKLYGETADAERIQPVETDRNSGRIIFIYPKKPFRLFISDMTGNLSTYMVHTVE